MSAKQTSGVPAQQGGKPSQKGSKGGPTSAQMKAVGRNMARANNQRGG